MGEDQNVKKTPKWLDGYKDKERRKEWQRNYQRERYHKLKAEKGGVTIKVKEEETMPQAVEQTLKTGGDPDFEKNLKLLTDTLGKEDPIAQALDKYGKYIPLAMQFLSGFQARAQEARAEQMQQYAAAQQRRRIEPPEGWLSLGPVQKLSRKYDGTGELSAWYRQGLAWEAQQQGQEVYSEVVSHAPVDLPATRYGRRLAASSDQNPPHQSMAELNQRAANEVWDKKEDQNKAPEEKAADPAAAQPQQQPAEADQNAIALKQVGEAMMEDNKKYLGLVLDYFKNRPIKDFESDLNNVDAQMAKLGMFLGFLPVQTREMIKRTSLEDLEQMLKEADPKKIKLIEKKKLKPKLKELWEKVQKSV